MGLVALSKQLNNIAAITRPDNPKRLREVFAAFGQMPDGSNYLIPNNQGDAPTIVATLKPIIQDRTHKAAKKMSESRVYKAWNKVAYVMTKAANVMQPHKPRPDKGLKM